MLDFFRSLLESESLSPHGICLLWRPELIWTHVISDTLIGAAYFSIPVALAYFVSKRQDVAFGWVFWAFAVFILACGTTHFLSIWTLWVPDYGAEALVKALTAAASVVTAFALWPLLPQALALPSPAQLRLANEGLQQRIAERDAAIEALHRETAERLRTEEMFRQAQKMEAIGQLTGGFAHDFNNLLTVVIGNLDIVQRKGGAGETVNRAVRNAVAGAEKAALLTQQLLAFARKQPLQPQVVDPNDLATRMGGLFGRTLKDAISLRFDLAPDAWPVLADQNQLESAMLNLLVNARDALPDGGRITVATRNIEAAGEYGDCVALAITDTGTGMTDDVKARVFEPFFTTKPLGLGTGLGLSQVHGFMAQSGGRLLLDSAPGEGTTVALHLPRAI
jgi:signal transduction histidine kinase